MGRRSSRVDEGRYVIEGPTLLREAIAAGVPIEAVFVDADRLDLLVGLGPHRDAAVAVRPAVLDSVLSSVSPQPICAIATIGEPVSVADLARHALSANRAVLVLCDVGDPGNAGTLLRAAEASGCAGVILAGACVDLHNPKVVRAAAGSMFRLRVAVDADAGSTLERLASDGIVTVASVVRDGVDHLEAPLDGAVAIVVGNEARGLSEDQVAACCSTVTVAMDGPAESLNVAMAGTVLCFEALRRRRL